MTDFRLADRMGRLGTESAFEVLARAKAMEAAGHKIIHLEIGEPDFPTAGHIVEAAVEALRAGHTHYVPAPGIPQLREGNDFRIDTDELARLVTDRSKLLIINSPHNPCGSALTREDCEAIADIALRHDLTVLTDEVYWAIRYGGSSASPGGGPPGPPHASVLEVDGMADRTILLDGWSKTFAMTGWRLGFGVFPPALVEPITRLAINSVSCTSAFSQYAAIAALEGPWQSVDDMVAEFHRRRDIIVAGLNDIPGISCLEPQGAFYVFPNIAQTGLTSAELQARLLQDAGVAALGGTAFGPYGEGYLRFSYANSVENIKAALEAIRAQLT